MFNQCVHMGLPGNAKLYLFTGGRTKAMYRCYISTRVLVEITNIHSISPKANMPLQEINLSGVNLEDLPCKKNSFKNEWLVYSPPGLIQKSR